jgi:5-methyltetrahydrofolate--homocysteine methyltransferase
VQFSWVKKKFDERLTEEDKMVDFNAMQDALVQCDRDKLEGLVNAAMAEGTPATDILNRGLIAGMDIVGDKMENEDMFIPEVLLAAKIMGGCVSILKPLLGDDESSEGASVIIGTVKGDLHDIGKNLVSMMMESGGMTVHNLGVDIPEQGNVVGWLS